ncbi:hypothetical protein BCR41DRAFT_388225 [Lobosporangium transversale]|uniref:Putative gamma-glutamylcyclotransferase n=1 Tax=Lobosporangium transversale TaxID=64571 RepID=A0A1Y2GFX2_9FUNG|nr:hypothetical protein BCR41DRAFT_388225 [Lobosporangium transversale]ORZ09699.1 hypothetical protein BCR41DRAFT_388225 [Lobosporangium transversale]|eukprot:XP_021878969.1 hypothetical protein BCR41DRAFT_388225 [Lobosporangium transversale]
MDTTVMEINSNVPVRNAPPCFFYGSLMESNVLNAVTRPKPDAELFSARASIKRISMGTRKDLKPICLYLQGYTRYTYHNQPFPGMIPSDDAEEIVEGLLVFGHSDLERHRLDQFEGPEYPRIVCSVTVHEKVPARFTINKLNDYEPETVMDAFVYVFKGPIEHLDLKRPWDYEAFKQEHVLAWMTADATFKSMVERTENRILLQS